MTRSRSSDGAAGSKETTHRSMRATFLEFLLFFLFLVHGACFAGGVDMVSSASSKQEVIAKHSLLGRHVETSELRYEDKNFLAVVVDVGSGISRKTLYLYVQEARDAPWTLLAYRPSNSSSIRIASSDEGISVYSKNGKKLLVIPRDALTLKFDPLEQ